MNYKFWLWDIWNFWYGKDHIRAQHLAKFWWHIGSLTYFGPVFMYVPYKRPFASPPPPPSNCILFIIYRARGNLKFFIWQKSHEGTTFGPIRWPTLVPWQILGLHLPYECPFNSHYIYSCGQKGLDTPL